MSSVGVAEQRIKGDRKPRVNLCGDCGCCIPATELLCSECREGLRGKSMEENVETSYSF
jgi:hypothetical protein